MSYGNIRLWWSVPKEADTYNLYHSTSPFSKSELPVPVVTGLTQKTYRHLGLLKQADHYYRVASVKDEVLYISNLFKISKLPENHTISCDGAVNTCTVGTVTEGSILAYYINGIEVINGDTGRNVFDALEQYGIQAIPLDSEMNPTISPEYVGTQYCTYKNITNETLRIKIVSIDANSVNDYIDPTNPTVIATGSEVTFCLSSKPLISCDGATSSVVFADNPDYTARDSIISIVINDVEYQKPEDLPQLLPLIQTNDGDQIRMSLGGVHPYPTIIFENLGTRPARIKLRVSSDTQLTPNILDQQLHASNTNPTVVFDTENFEVNFCLSVSSPV